MISLIMLGIILYLSYKLYDEYNNGGDTAKIGLYSMILFIILIINVIF